MLLRSALHGSEALVHFRRIASLVLPMLTLSISRLAEAFPETLLPRRDIRRSVTSDHPTIAPHNCLGVMRLIDAVVLITASVLCHFITDALASVSLAAPMSSVSLEVLTAVLSMYSALFALNLSGKYQLKSLAKNKAALLDNARAAAAFAVAASLCDFLLNNLFASPAQFAATGLAAFSLLSLSDIATRQAIGRLKASAKLAYRVAVLGSGSTAAEASAMLTEVCGDYVTVVGLYNPAIDTLQPSDPSHFKGTIADLIADSRRHRLDAVLIAPARADGANLDSLLPMLETVLADIYLLRADALVTHLAAASNVPSDGQAMPRSLAARIKTRPIAGSHATRKRVFDVMFASSLLVLFLPFFVLIALAIKAESRGPVLFRQPRIGLNKTVFIAYKFRTMFDDMADLHATRQTSRNDPRVTRVGRVLRRFSIDELPQLLNIVSGSMSLVGPRPHAPQTTAEGLLLADAVEGYDVRHCVKPGLSGWAQVHGWRGQITSVEHLARRLEHDLFYIHNWSLWLDVRIVFLTLKREVVSRHAF